MSIQPLEDHLKAYFGHNTFREHQKSIISAILDNRDVLAILPTGSGKSLCYQLPASLREGTCVVISPLIALMIDQVRQLAQLGIQAAYLNSALTRSDQAAVFNNLAHYKLVYVSPEKFLDPDFLAKLDTIKVSSVVIDEAHCISQWGHSFRPEYRQLAVIRDRFPGIPVSAFTATATKRVTEDISAQLNMNNPHITVGSFDRKNLMIRIHDRINMKSQLSEFLKKNGDQSGIIYAPTRKKVDDLADWLKAQGVSCVQYHAGMTELQRQRAQEAFISDQVPLIVATVAFGMGINKPDVRYVIHTAMPQSMEQYYQEIGRAGRDGEPAECWCLHSVGDKILQRQFAFHEPDSVVQKSMLQKVDKIDAFCQSTQCRRQELLRYFDEVYAQDNCQNCDNCTEEIEWIDGEVISQKILSCVYRLGQNFGVQHTVQVLRGSAAEAVLNRGHDKLSTYGLLGEYSASDIRYFIYALINQGHLLVTEGQYPVLKFTASSREILRGQPIQFKKRYKAKTSKKKSKRSREETNTVFNREMFAELKEMRKSLAEKENVPPYVIFHDKTLKDIATYFPDSMDGLLKITGIGPAKAERFGKLVIPAVQKFCAASGVPTNQFTA